MSSNHTSTEKVALSALTALLALNALAAANTIAQTPIAPPIEVFPAIFADVGWSAFALPLLWTRHGAGYVAGIAVGLLSLTWPFLVLFGVVGELGASVTLSPLGIGTYLGLPVVLIVTSALAGREALAAQSGHLRSAGPQAPASASR